MVDLIAEGLDLIVAATPKTWRHGKDVPGEYIVGKLMPPL